MELSRFLWLLLPLSPLLYLCLHKLTLRNNSRINAASNVGSHQKQSLPMGSTGWPLLGESLDYLFKVKKGVPYKFVKERMNKYSSKIFRTSLIGEPMAIFCNAEGNKFLFSNEKKLVQVWLPSATEKFFPKSNGQGNNEHLKTLRKLLPVILKADGLREYVEMMDEVMKQHVQKDWENKVQVKVGDMAKRYVLTLACKIFLGINDPGKIVELAKGTEDIANGLHSMPINFPGTAFSRGIKASKLMHKEIEAIVRQRKVDLSDCVSLSSRKDFMSHMLLATDDNGQFFSEADLASHLVGMMQAAYTTVHITITIIMKYLAELPYVYNSVLGEQKEIADSKEAKDKLSWEDLRNMRYSWNVAREVLRLMPPGIGAFREVLTDFTYEGYTIPKGWEIHWIAHATYMSPEYFPNPENFDPSRFDGDGPIPYTFVPFGGGSRMCPGYEYARVAILIFMHNVVTKFRWEKQIPDEKVIHNLVPKPASGLPIGLHPHKP